MQRLTEFSIESDQIVLLHFADGTARRHRYHRLSEILTPPDLLRVQKGMRLRRSFLRRHMPRWLVLAFATTGVAAMVAGCIANERTVAEYLHFVPTVTTARPTAAHAVSVLPEANNPAPGFSGASRATQVVPPVETVPATLPAQGVATPQEKPEQPVSLAQHDDAVGVTSTDATDLITQTLQPVSSLVRQVLPGLGL